MEGRAPNGCTDPTALLECVTILLTYGANPNRKDKEGLSVLHYLSAGWQYPVVELLLDGFDNKMAGGKRSNCADVNIFDDIDGWTALHYVCSSNSLQHRYYIMYATKICLYSCFQSLIVECDIIFVELVLEKVTCYCRVYKRKKG